MEYALTFTNIDNGTRHYASKDEAIAAGKRAGFEFAVRAGGRMVASWTVFGGLRNHGA